MLLDYWNQPDLTEELFVGDWMLTGDAGSFDEDGHLHYEGRGDDAIITAGQSAVGSPLTDAFGEGDVPRWTGAPGLFCVGWSGASDGKIRGYRCGERTARFGVETLGKRTPRSRPALHRPAVVWSGSRGDAPGETGR